MCDKNDMRAICQRMADLTYLYCKKHCKILGSCCNSDYCDMADRYAQGKGITIQKIGNKIPFLGENDVCIVPPEYRILCTCHQCDIGSLGFFKDDSLGVLTKEYFAIRCEIDKMLTDDLL
jgi:hypothetical protein